MTFAGLAFIFHFFPIFLLAYYITPVKYRGITLLIGSLIFYSFNNPINLLILVGMVLLNYLFSYKIHLQLVSDESESAKSCNIRRTWLIVAIIVNISLLAVYKYLDNIIQGIDRLIGTESDLFNLSIPLGISFFTFQMLSFVFDTYNGKYAKGVSLLNFATYATMFPQLSSGPITRYSSVQDKLEKRLATSPKYLEEGIATFVLGLAYKILLADKIAALWSDVWRVGPQGVDVLSAWLGAWAYSFEIYFDFFGYSLMAIGVGLMLGFRLPDNFKEPYSTKTMTSFWRNWHISLGQWFRDYLYIPLGGNRCSEARMAMNMFIVWMLTAIWHGPTINFVIWGAFLFLLIYSEKKWTGKWLESTKILGHVYMMIIIPVSWLIFNVKNPVLLYEYFMRMLGINIPGMAINGLNKFVSLIETYWWILGICVLFATPLPMKLIKKYQKKPLLKGLLFVLFWLSVYEIIVSGNNPFIYFSF